MSFAQVNTWAIGPDGLHCVQASAQLQGGLPITRVLKQGRLANGLKDRIRAAIRGAGYKYPPSRITLDIDLPNECPLLEQHAVPLALAILIASDQIPKHIWLQRSAFGALQLDGQIPQLTDEWHDLKSELDDSIRHLAQAANPPALSAPPASGQAAILLSPGWPSHLAELCLAGHHSVLLYGEPGVGKTRWSRQLQSGWCDSLKQRRQRNARQLFHQFQSRANAPAEPWKIPVGSGAKQLQRLFWIRKGHVLAIEDLPLHTKGLRDALAQTIDQNPEAAVIATANPCACGWLGSHRKACRCNPKARQRWQDILTPPILDRFDILARYEYTETTPVALQTSRIRKAWQIQWARQNCLNGALACSQLNDIPGLLDPQVEFLREHAQALGLTGRAQLAVSKVARTLADLNSCSNITDHHLAQAIALRASPHEH